MGEERRRRWRRAGRYGLLAAAAAVVLLPVYLTVVASLLPAARVVQYPPALWPSDPQWGNYRVAVEEGSLGRYLANSALVSGVVVAGQLLTSVLAAYAFAYLRFPARRVIFVAFLATLMVPFEVTVVANFRTVDSWDWVDTYQGLTVPFLATAFGTFLLRQAFLGLPRDLRDAAALDGYGHLGFLARVAVPLARPALGALAVLSFLLSWNSYLWPLLVTNDERYRTVQVGLRALAGQNVDRFNVVAAGTVVAALPILVLLVAFQRQLVRGLTSGAIKG